MTTSPSGPRGVVCLLARAPSAPGKTRLTADMPADRAVALRRALFLDTLESAIDAGLPTVVCHTPAAARNEMASVVSQVISAGMERFLMPAGQPPSAGLTACRLIPQSDGDLGARMHAAFTDVFALGVEKVRGVRLHPSTLARDALRVVEGQADQHVVLIGSDLPTLPPEYLTMALAALERVPIVIGPAEDGGYYLLGLREPCAALFEGIAWGTRDVLAQTIAIAGRLGLAFELLPPWHDVDAPQDLSRIVSPRARHTRAWLESS